MHSSSPRRPAYRIKRSKNIKHRKHVFGIGVTIGIGIEALRLFHFYPKPDTDSDPDPRWTPRSGPAPLLLTPGQVPFQLAHTHGEAEAD